MLVSSGYLGLKLQKSRPPASPIPTISENLLALENRMRWKVRIPYLDFAEDFIKVIQSGEKKASRA